MKPSICAHALASQAAEGTMENRHIALVATDPHGGAAQILDVEIGAAAHLDPQIVNGSQQHPAGAEVDRP